MDSETAAPASRPVPPEVVEMALQAVRDFHECFWFRHPEAEIANREDVELVIDHLRRYGGHRAWRRAQEMRSCL